MTGLFGCPYARQYDALYGEKNYLAECDAVEALWRQYSNAATHSVLDLGCGTATHALLFAERGYAVTGVDRAPAMLERAREKAAERAPFAPNGSPEFVEGDIRTLRLGRTFDAALMMFAVLGYQTTDADLGAALRTVHEHLAPGGLFICDVWYGPAVLAIGTSERMKKIELADGRLYRKSSGCLDEATHTCRVELTTWRTAGGREAERSTETHTMRYFFPREIEALAAAADMELCALRAFDDVAEDPGPDTWNVWVCARRS